MRPVTLEPSPVFHPFKCIRCKTAAGPLRLYFIDLGLDISGEFNPMYDGNIYYCNECAHNLVVDVLKVIQVWDVDHAPWQDDNKSTITYNWEKTLGVDGTTTSGSDSGAEIILSEPERDDPDVAESTEVSDGTVPNVPRDEPSSLSVSRDGFAGFQ